MTGIQARFSAGFSFRGAAALIGGAFLVTACSGNNPEMTESAVCGDGLPGEMAVTESTAEGSDDLLVVVCFPDTTHSNPGWVATYRLAEDGTFEEVAKREVGRQPSELLVSDLDGDGVADILVANTGGLSEEHHLSFLKGEDDGTLAEAVRFPAVYSGFVLNDVNGDGRRDIVIAGENAVLIADDLAEAGFHSGRLPGVETRDRFGGVVAGMDGHQRYGVVPDFEADTIHVFADGAAGKLDIAIPEDAPRIHSVLAAGDLNFDEQLDLVVAVQADESIERTIHLLLSGNDGAWRLSEAVGGVTAFPKEIALASSDDGGQTFVFVSPWADPEEDRDYIEHFTVGPDGKVTPGDMISLPHYPYGMAVGDFSADGSAEIVIRDMDGQRVTRLSVAELSQD